VTQVPQSRLIGTDGIGSECPGGLANPHLNELSV